MERVRERKAVGMRRARDILQSPSGPDRGESHEIRTQRICYRYNSCPYDCELPEDEDYLVLIQCTLSFFYRSITIGSQLTEEGRAGADL